jgi:ubiquinone/menaquinone biosynthesis C-methylase UbiE
MSGNDVYATRKLAEGYPNLGALAHEHFVGTQSARADDEPRVDRLLRLMGRLIHLEPGQRVCVIGCGPVPQIMGVLSDRGFDVSGVEPVVSFVNEANAYLGRDAVLVGAAECIPLPTESQHVVFFENVLEHVESPVRSLEEIYRVLMPGGIVLLTTTNRQRISLSGDNGEYNVRFFNWLPRLVQESFVFSHLHYRPSLANYTERPAVHWFSYADLCALGRHAGFAQFYSLLDLRRRTDVPLSGSVLKRWLLGSRVLETMQRSPWLRSLALTQIGADIIMLKRGTLPAVAGGTDLAGLA